MLELFQKMKLRLAQPDMAFFTHYRDDFDVIDREEIVGWGSPNARYLWAVRASGTYLVRIGINRKQTQQALDLLAHVRQNHRTNCMVFLIGPEGIRELDLDRANTAVEGVHEDYVLKHGFLMRTAGPVPHSLGRVDVEWIQRYSNATRAVVRFTTTSPCTADDLSAMRVLALQQAVQESGSLAAKVSSMTVNGTDLIEALHVLRMQPTATLHTTQRSAQAGQRFTTQALAA